jgi:hypothetical protein
LSPTQADYSAPALAAGTGDIPLPASQSNNTAQASGPFYYPVQLRNPIRRHPKFCAKQVLRDFDVRLFLVRILIPDKIEECQRYNRLTVQGPFASTNISGNGHLKSPASDTQL